MAERGLRNVRIVVAYKGTNYGGWQRQPNAVTIQELLEETVRKVTGERVTVIGSGRTDAGVHALGQVANFKTASRLDAEEFVGALNAYLPADVAVLEAAEVPIEFNSRTDARRKTYRYHIWRSAVRPVVWGDYVYHRRSPLDPSLMAEAAVLFEGRHDFGAFATELDPEKDTVREIHVSRVDSYALGEVALLPGMCDFSEGEARPFRREGELIAFTVTGSGFLYNMVRAMAGTLMDVGRRAIPPEEIGRIMAARDRRRAGPTAPPQGLVLVGVDYSAHL